MVLQLVKKKIIFILLLITEKVYKDYETNKGIKNIEVKEAIATFLVSVINQVVSIIKNKYILHF